MMSIIRIDEPASKKMTKQKFKLRLTQAERIAIREAAKDDADVYDFQDLLDSGSHADLDDPLLGAGLLAMEQYGLIGEGRAAEILSPPVDEDERWNGA